MPEYTQGAANQVLQEGDYPFIVDDAGEKESKSGNTMIELQLLIIPDPTKPGVGRVYDNLVFVESAYWKIDEFRICTGEKLDNGQKVSFEAEDCIDRHGIVHLIVETYDGRTRNKVGAYLPPQVGNVAAPAMAATSGVGGSVEPDDIPFGCDRG